MSKKKINNFTFSFEFANCGLVDSVDLADGKPHTHSARYLSKLEGGHSEDFIVR